jgi:antitoxin MazE
MRITKWGNSLAVRIPAEVADALHLKEGDDVEIVSSENRKSMVSDEEARREALERIRSANWELPPGWKIDREEANER